MGEQKKTTSKANSKSMRKIVVKSVCMFEVFWFVLALLSVFVPSLRKSARPAGGRFSPQAPGKHTAKQEQDISGKCPEILEKKIAFKKISMRPGAFATDKKKQILSAQIRR